MESRDVEPAGCGRSFDRPVSPAQPNCLLTIGSQRLTAILADERETGLHVLIQGSPLFWVEDTGVLQTSEGEIAVRVSNIVRMETGEDDFSSSMPGFRIGLACLTQAELKLRPPTPPIPVRKAPRKLHWLRPLSRVRISVGGLIGVALIVTPLVFVAAAWQHHVHQTDGVDSPAAVAAAHDGPISTPTIERQLAVPTGYTVPTVPEPSAEILQLPGVEPFLKPEVVKKLELTPSQTGAFGRLDKTTQEALQDLEKYWESTGRLELARRRNVLLEAARQEALQLLTDQQRRQWEAMTR